jgi:hypothetical protein
MSSLFFVAAYLFLVPEPAAAPPLPFTADRFREHVAYLAADDLAGRAVGSPGSEKATDYISRHLKEYGASGLGPGGAWIQTFPYATKVNTKSETNLTAGAGPALRLGKDFAIAPESPDGQFEAEAVFIGYGATAPKLDYDDFAGVDLQGKVAVALPYVSQALEKAGVFTNLQQKWTECERRGAVALIVVQAPNTRGLHTDWELPYGNKTRQIACVYMDRKAAATLFPKTDQETDALVSLESALNGEGKPKPQSRPLQQKVALRFRLERTPVMGRNLLGIVPGKGALAKEAVIVNTHHDHLGTDPDLIKAGKDGIYNGADDNASGCAALLLLAQALHAARDKPAESYRSVIFASFDAEERGLVGSRYYVNHPLWPLERTVANINFDMVGRLNLGKLIALDCESSAFLAERILALAPLCGLTVETRLNGSRRSDHANFMDRAIPAVHFNTGMHVDYHQVTDEVERIDAAGGARVSWLSFRLLRETMDTPSPLRYRRPSPSFDVQSILQLAFKLGFIPEQNAQSGRTALIRYVVPGSLIAKHGVKSGDEITGVNGVEFTSLIDAAIMFGQLRFDQGLRLTVRRQGKSFEVALPAAAVKDLTGPTVRSVDKDQFEVLFRYKPAGKVKSVTLAGTFNEWNISAQALDGPDKEGYFSTRLRLKAGTYEYKFVLDGKTWMSDPNNYRVTGPNRNGVLTVGAAQP